MRVNPPNNDDGFFKENSENLKAHFGTMICRSPHLIAPRFLYLLSDDADQFTRFMQANQAAEGDLQLNAYTKNILREAATRDLPKEIVAPYEASKREITRKEANNRIAANVVGWAAGLGSVAAASGAQQKLAANLNRGDAEEYKPKQRFNPIANPARARELEERADSQDARGNVLLASGIPAAVAGLLGVYRTGKTHKALQGAKAAVQNPATRIDMVAEPVEVLLNGAAHVLEPVLRNKLTEMNISFPSSSAAPGRF